MKRITGRFVDSDGTPFAYDNLTLELQSRVTTLEMIPASDTRRLERRHIAQPATVNMPLVYFKA